MLSPHLKAFFKQWNTLLCKDQNQNVFHVYKRVKTEYIRDTRTKEQTAPVDAQRKAVVYI